MRQFHYYAPGSIEEACTMLAEHAPSCRILAGGTDLIIELRRPAAQLPGAVVDISRIVALRGIKQDGPRIAILPLVTHRQLMQAEALQRSAPFLAQAAGCIGSPQIRNRGTIGGNIMNAATCADTVPPLAVLGATVTLQSTRGRRELPLEELFVAPYRTQARPEELLVEISFTGSPAGAHTSFLKLGRRNALSIARLSVAAMLVRDAAGAISDARIATGAAYPTSRRLEGVEKLLRGEKPSQKLFKAAREKASEMLLKEMGHRWSSEYKVPVLGVLVERALEECAR